jgi:hypothetical protein
LKNASPDAVAVAASFGTAVDTDQGVDFGLSARFAGGFLIVSPMQTRLSHRVDLRDQCSKAAQILSDRRQSEFISGPAEATQAKSVKLEDSF